MGRHISLCVLNGGYRMGVRARLLCLGIGAVIGLAAGTQFVAAHYGYHRALGWGLELGGGAKLYPPWDILVWAKMWSASPTHGPVMRAGAAIIVLGVALGAMMVRLFDTQSGAGREGGAGVKVNYGHRARGWGDPKALIKAGLTGLEGVVLGRINPPSARDFLFAPKLLTSPDMRPALVTGGTRSGKGRGIVVPTLLTWNWSTIVFDPKGELWATTAGFRAQLGPTLFFNPLHLATARFNPLAEIGTGDRAVSDVQKLVGILAEPGGGNGQKDFWEKQASELLSALILHTLYSEAPENKTLIGVKRLSADLDATAKAMSVTLHRLDNKGNAITDPYIADVANAYLSAHERGRKSVQMTVRSFLSWIAGSEIENALSVSDFRLSDLMCARAPISLYVQIAPSDLKSLQPLVRLFYHLAASAFTTHLETDSDGRPKENALLLALDEFPLLGKVSFFEDVVRLSAGYGIKCLFVAQSLNDIARIYGPLNGFLDNTHIYVAFAALDPMTREKVSKLTGLVTDTRMSASLPHHFADRGGSRTIAEVERSLMDPSEVGALPDDQQLVFIAGHRPYRLTKLQYDKVEWMADRAAIKPHDQAENLQTPERPIHPWIEVKPAGFGDPQSAQTFEERAEARRLEVQAEHEAAFRRAKTNRPRNGQQELNLEPSSEPEPTMPAMPAAPIVVIPLPTVPPLPDDTIVPANGDADNSEQIAANTNARNILKLLHEGDF
jgi:type IV secretion system protein VirD4